MTHFKSFLGDRVKIQFTFKKGTPFGFVKVDQGIIAGIDSIYNNS